MRLLLFLTSFLLTARLYLLIYKRKRQRPITFKVRDWRLIVHVGFCIQLRWIWLIRHFHNPDKVEKIHLGRFCCFFLPPARDWRQVTCWHGVFFSRAPFLSLIFFSIWCCWCLLCLEFWKWWIAYTWGCVPLYTIPPLRSFFLAKTFWSKGPAVFTPSLIPSL